MTIEPKSTDELIYSKLSTLTELYKYQIERIDDLENAVMSMINVLNRLVTTLRGIDDE